MFGEHLQGAKRMIQTDFGNPLIFVILVKCLNKFWINCHLNVIQKFTTPLRINCKKLTSLIFSSSATIRSKIHDCLCIMMHLNVDSLNSGGVESHKLKLCRTIASLLWSLGVSILLKDHYRF